MRFRKASFWIQVCCGLIIAGCACGALVVHVLAQSPLVPQGQVVFADSTRHAPDFTLQDQQGSTVSLHQFKGRVVALTFLDSHCTKDCPIIGRELALVQQRLGSRVPWTLLVVSVAPITDSPASSVLFADRSGWRGDWHWLFGTPTTLAKVWAAYGIWVHPTPTDIQHTAAIFLIGPDGYVRVADLVPFLPQPFEESIRALTAPPSSHWWDRLL